MNKKLIVMISILMILVVGIVFTINKCSHDMVDGIKKETMQTIAVEETIGYDLAENPKYYDVHTYEGDKKYIEFVKSNLYPVKLRNFVFSDDGLWPEEWDSGYRFLNDMSVAAYSHLFQDMFEKNFTDFSDCPVTEKFKEKYAIGLYKYYSFVGENIYSHTVDDIDMELCVEENIGVDAYGDYKDQNIYRFNYVLDEEGNVDDLILITKEKGYGFSEK